MNSAQKPPFMRCAADERHQTIAARRFRRGMTSFKDTSGEEHRFGPDNSGALDRGAQKGFLKECKIQEVKEV